MARLFGSDWSYTSVDGPVDVAKRPSTSDDCNKSHPGIPILAIVTGCANGPYWSRLNPMAIAAMLLVALPMVALATWPMTGRPLDDAVRVNGGTPQPTPYSDATAVVPS